MGEESEGDIADVFSDFYSDLYAKREGSSEDTALVGHDFDPVVPVSVEEVRNQLKTMANRKCADTRGVVAELLKACGDDLLEIVAQCSQIS